MYVAAKGGETAIRNAHGLLARRRRGAAHVPELQVDQVEQQLALAVARVMAEGALYDRRLAALAIKQARGDMVEAVFLLRAYRTTLPRFGASLPVDTAAMHVDRRISATFKDLPGGQVLGPTFDYTHRLLDFALEAEAEAEAGTGTGIEDVDAAVRGDDPDRPRSPGDAGRAAVGGPAAMPRVADILGREDLIEPETTDPGTEAAPVPDLTRDPLSFPADRPLRLQNLARGDEGFLLALGYSTQRGYGRNHPFVGELRVGMVAVEIEVEELGFAIEIGELELTECQLVNQFAGTDGAAPRFTRGYGLVFGHGERKAMSMALVDRALRAGELGEERTAPAQDEEFVLAHSDNVQATGFVEHLKLPHYVDFQSELDLLRRLRAEHAAASATATDGADAQGMEGEGHDAAAD